MVEEFCRWYGEVRLAVSTLTFSPIHNNLWVSASSRWYLYRDNKFLYYLTDKCDKIVRMFRGYYELMDWLYRTLELTPKFRQEVVK